MHARVVGAEMGQKRCDEPDDQGDQQQRRHPLHPPMGHALLGRAQAARPAQRSVTDVSVIASIIRSRPAAKPAMKEMSVSTVAAATTVQPLA